MSTLDNLRKAAKRWLKALRDSDAGARARLARVYPDAPKRPTLRDVQHALARERGHESWIALTRAIGSGLPPEAGETPLAALLAGAGRGDAAAVAAILDEHPGIVNDRGTLSGDTGWRTALHYAAERGNLPVVRLLIEHGADLNLEDAVGLTPLDQAALAGEDEMTRLLLAAGATLTLPAAIVLDRADQVERLIREDPEILSGTNNRRWARLLVHASGRVSGRVVETVLQTVTRHRAGLSIVNMEDDEETAVDGASGYTPLHARRSMATTRRWRCS